jgi:transposase
VEEVSEYKTSSKRPFCRSGNITTNGRLFKCLNCGLEANRDAVGVLNIGCLHLEGSVNGVVAHPLLLRLDGMKWEPRRAMNNRSNEHSRSRNLPTLVVESVNACKPLKILGRDPSEIPWFE